MTAENIKNIILQGEGIDVEFKKSNTQLPGNIYDTICDFLNRRGGHILLGVDDDGTVLGVAENWNRPYNWGIINPENAKPHPKNLTIANFFRQLGWVEELGYGIRNMFKYCPLYLEGALPIIEEKDLFKITIQYEDKSISTEKEDANAVDGTVSGTVKNRIKLFIAQHEGANSNQILATFPALTLRTLRRILSEFKKSNEIEFRGAPKTGGYFLIDPKE